MKRVMDARDAFHNGQSQTFFVYEHPSHQHGVQYWRAVAFMEAATRGSAANFVLLRQIEVRGFADVANSRHASLSRSADSTAKNLAFRPRRGPAEPICCFAHAWTNTAATTDTTSHV